ncbi:MAG TPA: hypothetical protein VG759_08500 [Candidatus Angelobacter sp.]|jgi:hypothetical protein|nr:hypothetical protein [Candidatus Angelobacter sp.]
MVKTSNGIAKIATSARLSAGSIAKIAKICPWRDENENRYRWLQLPDDAIA